MANNKYYLKTFGCQSNLADSERIMAVCEAMGYGKTSSEKDADLIIYNTCSVKQSAEDRVFGLNKKVQKLKIENRKLKIVLTGCMMHYGKKELRKRLPEFDFFVDIKEIQNLPKLFGKKTKFKIDDYLDIPHKSERPFIAHIPISSGCNNFCSYCIVPYARGREYSRPAKEIIREAKTAAKNGAKEIWLLGQNVNSYGLEEKTVWGGKTRKNEKSKIKKGCMAFSNLLREVNKIKGDFWIRFMSPHPKDFSDDLIKAISECEKMPKYIHLPVQSGNDDILKKMNRSYTASHYKKLVQKIRKMMPDISISTDTIVGFPGETKKQFQDTIKLYKDIKFDMAFISEYSPRSGTAAAIAMKDNVSKQGKEQRRKKLTAILAKTALDKNKKYVGKIEKVLVESQMRGKFFGRNGSYKLVEIIRGSTSRAREVEPPGKFVDVKIIKAESWKLIGKII